jgi:hypothetical protein
MPLTQCQPPTSPVNGSTEAFPLLAGTPVLIGHRAPRLPVEPDRLRPPRLRPEWALARGWKAFSDRLKQSRPSQACIISLCAVNGAYVTPRREPDERVRE